MANGATALFEVQCPCCQASLKIDPETRAVISHQAVEKPRTVEDMDTALNLLKGEAARREEAFQKSVEAHKKSKDVLARKFDELLKQAKESPDTPPPQRDIDLD
ncbi:MAG: hypothetical protein EHM65_00350 [Acidobacteriales bacterium]|nr:MAG: hypothetical protein EHM65_00350 [Terriglobales bacterium]